MPSATEEKSKRVLPPWLQQLLQWDVKVTKEVVETVNKSHPIQDMRHHLKYLEISCHGIPWFLCTFAGIYTSSNTELWVNMLIGLIVDIVIVAVTKAFTRRRRPAYNVDDMFAAPSVDKFSFPSGHATRAILLAGFFYSLYPLSILLSLPIVLWSLTVCASRVLLGRHHILDVIAGIAIGVFECLVLSTVWLSSEDASSLISTIGGEDPPIV